MSEINWFTMPESRPAKQLIGRIASRLEQDRNMLRDNVSKMALPSQLMGRMDQALSAVPSSIEAQVSLVLQDRPDLSSGIKSQIRQITTEVLHTKMERFTGISTGD